MRLVSVEPSRLATKKYTAIYDNGQRVHFGAKGYTDYTLGASDNKRQNYWNRHMKDLNVDNPVSPAYLSLYVLWGASHDIKENIKYYKERFGL